MEGIDLNILGLVIGGIGVLALLAVVFLVLRASKNQSELTGRLAALAESQSISQNQLNERLQTQERALSKTLEERLERVSRRVGDGLAEHSQKTQATMGQLHERLAVIDAAQKNITDMSSEMLSLKDILSNKQTRGAFGEIQLNDLVKSALPPSAYRFQAQLSNKARVDCLLTLPNPPGSIAVDAKFPLESYHALRAAETDTEKTQALRAFATAIQKHVNDISQKYILPGETAESALMFLPSEAVYAELHAMLPEVVEKSYRAKVWIVSPTTMMATLNTVRAVLKDATMREQAGVIQREIVNMLDDVRRLDDRVGKLQRHFDQAGDDMRQIRTSTEKITRRADRIGELEVGEDADVESIAPTREERDGTNG